MVHICFYFKFQRKNKNCLSILLRAKFIICKGRTVQLLYYSSVQVRMKTTTYWSDNGTCSERKLTFLHCPMASKPFHFKIKERKQKNYVFFRCINFFRLSKECFGEVLTANSPKLNAGRRSIALRPEIKLTTVLLFGARFLLDRRWKRL